MTVTIVGRVVTRMAQVALVEWGPKVVEHPQRGPQVEFPGGPAEFSGGWYNHT